jgi:hypothetical protein
MKIKKTHVLIEIEILTFGFISDRNELRNMDGEILNETIGVEAGFWGKKMVPLRFVWNGKRYEIKRVTMNFERSDGEKKYRCFAVDTGGMIAELRLDKEELVWKLGFAEAV